MMMKKNAMPTPKYGCRIRVHGPPPKSWVSGKKAGWNIASPVSTRAMKKKPTIQWLSRSEAL